MPADIPTLTQFNLAEAEDGYLLEVGGSDGATVQVQASAEQIGAIIEALDALLSDGDDAQEDAD